ncbi:GNAT family N-acetyltransferase [Thalassobacillus devorans]|uniref:GNAT family N-acetyltransferase n=1 Tax=Thalassobacillus devorans TaxID=279813 RepID=UPI0004B0CBEF|nr:GNAT family N-acetyltransferase [Thalassobacillus devorans]
MIEKVIFSPEEEFRERAVKVFEKHKTKIQNKIPEAEVYHVGSTAVTGSLTKGDVDLQVRVTQEGFDEAKTKLSELYPVNTGSDQTSYFCAFEFEEDVLPVGFQLTVKGTSVDHFQQMTRFFIEKPSYTEQYNSLKKRYEGADMEAYRKAKAAFLTDVLETPSYQEIADRFAVYDKVKFVEGEQYVTVEDTRDLTDQEMKNLVTHLQKDPSFDSKEMTLLIPNKFNVNIESFLTNHGFRLHDENVMVKKAWNKETRQPHYFDTASLHDIPEEAFKDIWEQAMSQSLNAPSSLDMDGHMQSVKDELGEDYQSSCLVAYEDGLPIGVVMPHIEPGTTDEGRLFYFGLVPEARSQGKSKRLHRQALGLLKEKFGACYYIGSTSRKNVPMLKTFEANGCTVIERNKVYKRVSTAGKKIDKGEYSKCKTAVFC